MRSVGGPRPVRVVRARGRLVAARRRGAFQFGFAHRHQPAVPREPPGSARLDSSSSVRFGSVRGVNDQPFFSAGSFRLTALAAASRSVHGGVFVQPRVYDWHVKAKARTQDRASRFPRSNTAVRCASPQMPARSFATRRDEHAVWFVNSNERCVDPEAPIEIWLAGVFLSPT
jgi:hypothetical protein